MNNSKQFLKDNNYLPRISFKDGRPHRVKILKDAIKCIKDESGQDIEGVEYSVIENGEDKTFFTSSFSLISQLSEYDEGVEVEIQMKSKKVNGKFQSYFEVAISDGEIPITEDESEPPLPNEE